MRFLTATLAVLDACVLFQGRLTNLLLWLAAERAFEPIWSAEIHDEWTRNLAISKLGIGVDKIAYRKSEMQRAFPAADCDADPSVILDVQAMCSNSRQRKDAHIVASAIASQAAISVTDHVRDFAPRFSIAMA
jgi:predicted nucleic acid-binding protein